MATLHDKQTITPRQDCNHTNIICDKIAGVYGCADCGAVTGHFETYAKTVTPRGMVAIGNGLYARTRGAK